MSAGLRGRRLAVYVFLCAVWGSTWLVIKIGLADLPPLSFAGLRMALACALLAPAALAVRGRRPDRREARLIALSGLLQIGVSYAFVFLASQWIASGLTALLFSSFPIWIAIFGHFLLPDEPLTARALAAGVLGIAGVGLIEYPAVAASFSGAAAGTVFLGGLLVLGSAIVSAFSNVLNKRSFARVSPVVNIWAQTLVGSAFLLSMAAVFERGSAARWTSSAVLSLVYLAVPGTALAFAALFWLIPRVPVSVVGSIPLVDTVVAVLLGRIVRAERLSGHALAGGALILVGVFFAVTPPERTKKPPGGEPATS
jgi:drug/metabolite transporter (DMT)-like permease